MGLSHAMRRGLVLLVSFFSAQASANLVWHADFETHDLSQWQSVAQPVALSNPTNT